MFSNPQDPLPKFKSSYKTKIGFLLRLNKISRLGYLILNASHKST